MVITPRSAEDHAVGSDEMPEVVESNQTTQSAAVEKYTGADVRRDPHEGYNGIPAAIGMDVEVSGSLTPVERAELESIMSPAQVEEVESNRRSRNERSAKTKKDNPQLIAAHAEEMMVEAANIRFHSGKGVGTWLIEHALHKPVRGFNAFGDALGGHGLKLPYMAVKGRRYYDLACIGWSQEQKDLRQAAIDEMGNDVRRSVIAD